MIESRLYPPMPAGKFDIIYCDPPWTYRAHLNTSKIPYKTLNPAQLKSLPVRDISAPDSLLFMWATGPCLDQAVDLGKEWGFSWATIGFIWNKISVCPGSYTVSQCELCLVFKRGKIPSPRGARNVRQYLKSARQKHSRKPDEVRRRITNMFPSQNKIELFARQRAEGWIAWGDQVSPLTGGR